MPRSKPVAGTERSVFLRRLAPALAAIALWASPARSEPISVTSHPVPLGEPDADLNTVGDLRYRGGIELRSTHPDFGGLSGLRVSSDGLSLRAVTDRGKFLRARLTYDPDGTLTALTDADLSPLPGISGARRDSDAEALSEDGSGGWVVAFEQQHRLMRFGEGHARIGEIAMPRAAGRLPGNSGIEALARLPGSQFLMLSEYPVTSHVHQGWLGGSDGGWLELSYVTEAIFAPTDAASLPTGDVLVLERAFHPLGGWGARVVHVEPGQLAAGTAIRGRPLATLRAPLTVDNFEGLAARPVPGHVRIYMLSDNNFNFLQRTLLLTFDWPQGQP